MLTPVNRVNLFFVYELDTWSKNSSAAFTLKYCLFGAVKLDKNADPYKFCYSRYGKKAATALTGPIQPEE